MYNRRLVRSGAASHTVSLPSSWIKRNKLNKGDTLHIKEHDNKLTITTQADQPQEQKEITIEIENKDIGTIRRETIAAYINNNSIFTFIGNIPQNLPQLKSILDNFLALEIIEQTNKRLVAKDFLNLKEFSPQTIIRRMDMLTRSMLLDAEKETPETLELTDYEVDKLYFLTSRLFRANLTNSSKVDNIEAFNMWWIAKNLENIADAVKKIRINDKSAKYFLKAKHYYIDCATAYFKHDKQAADTLMAVRAEIILNFDELKSTDRDFLKQIVNTSRNIAKAAVDF
jgi:phosphate uptake regulator